MGNQINALTQARSYCEEKLLPALRRDYPELVDSVAIGLVGNGSQCFGFDDGISHDHDWTFDPFIWVSEQDAHQISELKTWKASLFSLSYPDAAATTSPYYHDQSVCTAEDFYRMFIGRTDAPGRTLPQDIDIWLRLPEDNLAVVTNGAVFYDGLGQFSAIRENLLAYYPEDIRLKRIAYHCTDIAQTAQYNYGRMTARKDWVASLSTLSRFVDSAIALTFLINKRYKPYYKWQYAALKELDIFGPELAPVLEKLVCIEGNDDDTIMKRRELMERICAAFLAVLRDEGLYNGQSSFLADAGEYIQTTITDELLSRMPAHYLI